ncbi:SPW repeat protein [Luedemannella flava]
MLLAGLWLAISPWVLHFSATAPSIALNNLVLGIAVAVVAMSLTLMPQRMVRLSWATAVIGAWVVASPWIIQQSSVTAGIWINNVVTGAVTAVLGIAAGAILMGGSRAAGTGPATDPFALLPGVSGGCRRYDAPGEGSTGGWAQPVDTDEGETWKRSWAKLSPGDWWNGASTPYSGCRVTASTA